ncbi:hypothetical protein GCM10009533_14820 [Saccharopolyspora spinosporotrichia]|uniref:Uncharacterized protein n=1 Tax=Saccharopolyspora erythraea TaxID=1836 RepID=A0ABP3MAM8_SACER|nr:hypothetical protein [Saccharopolyspora erythraea]EQD81740.1 hypothetical protein N599_34470 [Saccharopolyspora erythraea D]
MQDEVDVELALLRTVRAQRVGAQVRPQAVRQRTKRLERLLTSGQHQVLPRQREDQLDPLVEPTGGHGAQFRPAEGDPREVGAEPPHTGHLDREQPERRGGLRPRLGLDGHARAPASFTGKARRTGRSKRADRPIP